MEDDYRGHSDKFVSANPMRQSKKDRNIEEQTKPRGTSYSPDKYASNQPNPLKSVKRVKSNRKADSEETEPQIVDETKDESTWIEGFSEKHQRKFWNNTSTGETVWKDPFKKSKSARNQQPVAHEESDLDDIELIDEEEDNSGYSDNEWEEFFSDKHDRSYWRNKESGETTWKDPNKSRRKKESLPPPPPPAPPAPPSRPKSQRVQSSRITSPVADDIAVESNSPGDAENGERRRSMRMTREQSVEGSGDKRPKSTRMPTKDSDGKSRGDKDGKKDSTASDAKKKAEEEKARFVGRNLIQYGLWAHFMSYGAALLSFWLGIFAMLWSVRGKTYDCELGKGQHINSIYMLNIYNGVCQNQVKLFNGESRLICCDPSVTPDLTINKAGSVEVGALYLIYSFFLIAIENTSFGCGLWVPNDTFFYRNHISPMAILNFMVGVVGLSCNATVLAGACLIATSLVQMHAANREEAGDGGRAALAAAKARAKEEATWSERLNTWASDMCSRFYALNPYTFCTRIYNEDKLSSYFWVFVFFAVNIVYFFYTLKEWETLINALAKQLKDGTLDLACNSAMCHTARKIVRYGPISGYAP